MTDDERDRLIAGLSALVWSLKTRVDDFSFQIGALRQLAIAGGITEAQLDAVVAKCRELAQASPQEAETAAEQALRRWLENFAGPTQ